jgi:hypothetical protein
MSDDHDHDGKLRTRTVGYIEAGEDIHVAVEHVYDNETCPEHGSLTDSGLVGVAIHDETPGGEQYASVLLTAADALLLADRITRAAHLALELLEDLPDVEREYLRHSERQDG